MKNNNCSPLNLLIGFGWSVTVVPVQFLWRLVKQPVLWAILSMIAALPFLGWSAFYVFHRWILPTTPVLPSLFTSAGYVLYLLTGGIAACSLYSLCIGMRNCCEYGALIRTRLTKA